MKYIYYIVLALLLLVSIVLLFKYAAKQAPTGPDSSTWALGIFFLVALVVIIGLSLLFFYFKWHKVALLIIVSPFLLIVATSLVSGSIDLYAWFPSFSPVKPLTLVVDNKTANPVHIKMDVMFPLAFSSDETVYKTLDYYAPANSKKTFNLSQGESNLVAKKASSVGVYVYQRDTLKASDGNIVERDGDNYIYKSEQTSAFTNGQYVLDVKDLFEKKGK